MYLPVNRADMNERGWEEVDFVLVTGDAYVDHPSFGTAIISRVLESVGYKVAILSQPDWRSAEDFKCFGKPRLGFLVNGGNVDSMVNNFSVGKNRRKRDSYSPGGKAGKRPDRAVTVYCNKIREAYGKVPIIIGGLEASLRRLGHYDYWDDKVRRSILIDSGADILIYGMGERAVMEIAEALDSGLEASDISWIAGTCTKQRLYSEGGSLDIYEDDVILPCFEEIARADERGKRAYCKSFRMQYRSNDSVRGKRILEKYPNGYYVVQNPPQKPLERIELDDVYQLPYMRGWHPSYDKEGGVPALAEVKFSITANRGCFGGCSFCAITYHQGREVRSRSIESVTGEARLMSEDAGFKGYIHDLGGPTANFTAPSCDLQKEHGMCDRKDCLFPKPCNKLIADHKYYMDMLDAVRALPGIKKVFIRSGIRFDYMLADKEHGKKFLRQLCENHVSGILKVAPEHSCPNVLKAMHKPDINVFDRFSKDYREMNKKLGKKQYIVPYFISSHPGATLDDAVDLALYMHKTGFVPDQVQDFYPTPGTLSTAMYYTEMDPMTEKPIYVARTGEEKKLQRALLHFNRKENRRAVTEALKLTGREELRDVLLGRRNER